MYIKELQVETLKSRLLKLKITYEAEEDKSRQKILDVSKYLAKCYTHNRSTKWIQNHIFLNDDQYFTGGTHFIMFWKSACVMIKIRRVDKTNAAFIRSSPDLGTHALHVPLKGQHLSGQHLRLALPLNRRGLNRLLRPAAMSRTSAWSCCARGLRIEPLIPHVILSPSSYRKNYALAWCLK